MSDVPTPDSALNGADIIVVGAGIVGVASALALSRQGAKVIVIDKGEPGSGASFGNAGHLATEQVFPIADASILKRLPGMLLDPMGPLRLDWRYLPKAIPWFVRLLLNLRPSHYKHSVAGIRALNEASLDAWRRLLSSIQAEHLLHKDGSLLVFERSESRESIESVKSRMEQQGVPVEFWDAEKVQSVAPGLNPTIKGGLFFPETGHFIDPMKVVNALVEAAKENGVRFVKANVEAGYAHEAGVSLWTDKGNLTASKVLVSCGAHSAHLTRSLTGLQVPLDTERGYHLMLPKEHERLPFAVTSLERRFIMTPMSGGLRLAGTVEFAGLKRAPNMARAWQLHRLTKGLFKTDLTTEGATEWMGFRPSLPDSLPVIDHACDGKVLLAFGHQHLGLTQAAVTAEMVAGISAQQKMASLPKLEYYRLDRF
ncbi:NAD(P)/FAD-dependent oxidoreductase [Pseudomonas putida]|uniref:NAD(P)/FAD-dependent oxidoreductase n=1 Tax=Pseudomonas putida TaxID=303 RepID=UPI0018AA2875|nr:FAD-dependent oxidoreductase [Pseudomonas putida]MBF8726772.1 FAD-binding oxidoreductase [Pseudomonas putida]MBF8764256.1 FAD-binding oxidoreductase [Pseudomonas putida]